MKYNIPKNGKKHRILFFKHSVDRLWRVLYILCLVTFIAWWFAPKFGLFRPPNDSPLIIVASVIGCVVIYLYIIRNGAYIQAKEDHLRLTIPFYSLKIPYDDVLTARPNDFGKLYSFSKMSWTEKRFLHNYFGATVLTLILKKYPKPKASILTRLPKYLFLPKDTGFIFLLKDWIAFSTEFESRMGIAKDTARKLSARAESINFRKRINTA